MDALIFFSHIAIKDYGNASRKDYNYGRGELPPSSGYSLLLPHTNQCSVFTVKIYLN